MERKRRILAFRLLLPLKAPCTPPTRPARIRCQPPRPRASTRSRVTTAATAAPTATHPRHRHRCRHQALFLTTHTSNTATTVTTAITAHPRHHHCTSWPPQPPPPPHSSPPRSPLPTRVVAIAAATASSPRSFHARSRFPGLASSRSPSPWSLPPAGPFQGKDWCVADFEEAERAQPWPRGYAARAHPEAAAVSNELCRPPAHLASGT